MLNKLIYIGMPGFSKYDQNCYMEGLTETAHHNGHWAITMNRVNQLAIKNKWRYGGPQEHYRPISYFSFYSQSS